MNLLAGRPFPLLWREEAVDGAYGRLVPVGDAEAFGDALAATLSEPRDPERQRQRAAEFSVERAVDRYVRLIRAYGAASAAA
jgi:glycosyltransferase involved in cell wall biosynthesis